MNIHITRALALATLLLLGIPAAQAGTEHHHRHNGTLIVDINAGPFWSKGYWHHGHHSDRYGWWWVVGGTWYLYPEPIYPYPTPYYQPPPIYVPQAQPGPAPAPAVWYYCDSTQSYYPYVPSCAEGWRTVPATPPPP
ncbi:MAG TPA: hypothetical protein VI279_02255 [Rhodocyclaceae bacterium]